MDKYDSELRDFFNEFYYPLKDNKYEERIHIENTKRPRNGYQRDYSRILYSPSFRRLQGKMQLLGVNNEQFYRNRLTHSLEVAQIARSITDILRRKTGFEDMYIDDIYVLEAASLAHDIGNPPFGHHGERILNELSQEFGGFEGNAQSLRVLMYLEKKLPDSRGLNLTIRTLLAVIKYFVPFNIGRKGKFIYLDQYNFFLEKIAENNLLYPRTVDVQIIDLADEIAYAAHDLEDALSLGLFNIDEFMFEFHHYVNNQEINAEEYQRAYEVLYEIVQKAKKYARNAANYHSSDEFSLLMRKEITSNIVDTLVRDIHIVETSKEHIEKTGTKNTVELGFKNLSKLSKGLKEFTLTLINRSNEVQLYEKQGERIIKGLYEVFTDKDFNKDSELLPVEYRDFKNELEQKRKIIDYISGMMDSFAIKTYKQFFGLSALENLYK